ncbi:MAG: AMP-binding protein [Actinomycetota bacterium]
MSSGTNLASLLHRDVDGPALVVDGVTVDHRALAATAARWRGGLVAAGIGPGDRVAIVAGSGVEFVAAHLAVVGLGAISVPLNPLAPAAELARELLMVEPAAAVADQRFAPALAAGIEQTLTLAIPALGPADLDGADPVPIAEVTPDQPAVLLFTSGTAGRPKPAILTHGNLLAGLQAVLSLPVDLVTEPHVYLGVIPLFHVFGLNTVLHLALLTGGTVVLGDYRDASSTIDLIHEHRVTIVPGPPTLWQALTRAPDVEPGRFDSVRIALSGAAKLAPQLRIDVKDRLGLELADGYGLTESAAVVAGSIGTDAPLGSVGRLMPGVEARIVDEDGADCLVGDPGELWVRGPMVFPGYWGVPEDEASGPLTDDGWLRTGDVAVVDEQGYLAIVDRRKDLIIVSGFNVFPAEVEGVIAAHPDVAEVGVVGEPSPTTGEAVVAFVVPEDGVDPDPEDLRRYCVEQLARYKVPSRFVIQSNLPIGPTGKLQRTRLR